jgi:hypothetical protein
MTWLKRLSAPVRGVLRRKATIDDIEREMRSHVELATEANIARWTLTPHGTPRCRGSAT